ASAPGRPVPVGGQVAGLLGRRRLLAPDGRRRVRGAGAPGGESGGGWGLGFGLQKPYGWDPWSCVQLRADGRSRACYYHDGGLTPWRPSPAVRDITAANVLRVEMRRQNVRWFINGQYVGQVNHPRSRPGELALHWFANEAPVDVRFERVRLWRIDPSGPVS